MSLGQLEMSLGPNLSIEKSWLIPRPSNGATRSPSLAWTYFVPTLGKNSRFHGAYAILEEVCGEIIFLFKSSNDSY